MRDAENDGGVRQSKLIAIGFIIIFPLCLFLGLLKLYDLYLLHRSHAVQVTHFGNASQPSLFELDLQPYTGFHSKANFHQKGPDIWTHFYKDFDIRSGAHGFFVDFDLDNPPTPEDNEFRVLLIGGSGAMGMGGRTNEDMLYRQLENFLNSVWQTKGVRVRVINLAMTGATTYVNYIALNRWGHDLDPDLILSFAGRNELMESGDTDLPYRFMHVMGVVDATKSYESPSWMKAVGRFYPGLIFYSNLGTALRMHYLEDYILGAKRKYLESSAGNSKKGINLYLHALASIKRDFPMVPILAVSQPWKPDSPGGYREDHDQLIPAAETRLDDFLEDYHPSGWFFLDLHREWRESKLYDQKQPLLLVDQNCHLSNEGHKVAAQRLAEVVSEIMENRIFRPTETKSTSAALFPLFSDLSYRRVMGITAAGPTSASTLPSEQEAQALKVYQRAIVITSHDHCVHPEDFQDFRNTGITARGLVVSVDGVYWQGGQRHEIPQDSSGWFERGNLAIEKAIEAGQQNNAVLIKTAQDISKAKVSGQQGVFLSFEGPFPMEGDPKNLEAFYEKGLRMFQMTWAVHNPFVYPDRRGNLTTKGEKLVAEANRLGIVIDITHMHERGALQVIEQSRDPVIISHGSPFGFLNAGTVRTRDSVIRALAKKQGVFCLHFNRLYTLRNEKDTPTVVDLVDFIDYLKALVGIDFIGLGPDWFPEKDYGKCFQGGQDPSELPNVVKEMIRRGYTEDEILKVLGENLLRVFSAVWK